MMFSIELGFTMQAAIKHATTLNHRYFCVEHLLESLISDWFVRCFLEKYSFNFDEFDRDIKDYYGTLETKQKHEEIEQTQAIHRVVTRASLSVQAKGKSEITGIDIFECILDEVDSYAVYYLNKQGITKELFLDVDLKHEEHKPENPIENPLLVDMVKQASEGKFDQVIGRDIELNRITEILSRRKKNNCMILGEPGIGKTALVEALAQQIQTKSIHTNLADAKLFSIDVSSIVAGTKYRGDFEEKLQILVEQLRKNSNVIVYIDEFHTVVGAGTGGNGNLDLANILKPILTESNIKVIASTTYDDYKKTIERDRALSRRFSTLSLYEPSKEHAKEILENIAPAYEKFHKVKYSKQALEDAVELSARYITDRFLPDKAIDVIDEAGSIARIKAGSKKQIKVSDIDIRNIVSKLAKVDLTENKDTLTSLKNLESLLKQDIYGQDIAVSSVVRSIKRNKAGLQTEHKPIGSFLFAGSTGVGKTELAKSLAKHLKVAFHRFDMSEYVEQHSIARLFGAPPGYVGYDEGGILTDLIRKEPYSVLLLDEIEKAHVDIYNVLLQILDDASLTDSHGKKSDFSNVIIILTTNAGTDSNLGIGFGNLESKNNRDLAVKKLFKPELRNRLDEIVYFNNLSPELMLNIVIKLLKELSLALETKNIKAEFTDKLKNYLAGKGYDPLLGARPLARIIQREVSDQLSEQILFGDLSKGGSIKVDYDGEVKILFNKS